MRILYCSSVDLSATNGPGINEREFVSHLLKRQDTRCRLLIPSLRHDNRVRIPVHAVRFAAPFDARNPTRWLRHQASMVRGLDAEIARATPDLVVIRYRSFSLWHQAIRTRRVPYAIKTLGLPGGRAFLQRNRLLGVLRPLERGLYRRTVAAAAVVDTVSESLRGTILRETDGRASVVCIDNGVNTELFWPRSREEARARLGLSGRFSHVLGYAGNLAFDRGGLHVVEALPALLHRYPRAGAIILGGDAGIERLQRRAGDLGVTRHCVFTGHVEYETVPWYISAMDVGVSMLRPEIQFESAQKVRQYIACGRPIVSTEDSRRLVEDNGLGRIVPYGSQSQFLEACVDLLEVSAEHQAMLSSRAFELARRQLSIESKVEERLAIWRQVVAQAGEG